MKLMRQTITVIVVLCACLLFCSAAFAADNSTKIVFMTASQLADKISTGELSSVQVVEAFLAQIDAHNPVLNAIVTLDREGALKRAAEADAALASGTLWGPLHGVPFTIKDNLATQGVRTTSGYPLCTNYIPDKNATVVKRLLDAGGILLGKTNMPLLGGDVQTNNSIFGLTSNPWNKARTPGGSSGGSAAAVAAGLSPLDIGNDLAGSIRIPAHFCGVFGLKPTERLVSFYGLTPGLSDEKVFRYLVTSGPLARSIDDLKLCLTIIAGPDNHDMDVAPAALTDPPARTLKDLRIVWTDGYGGVPITAETRNALQSLATRLADMGCHVEKASPMNFDFNLSVQTVYELIGLQKGKYMPGLVRWFKYITTKDPYFEPLTIENLHAALDKRDKLTAEMEDFLSQWDVWLCPVTSTAAFDHMTPSRYDGTHPVYKEPIYVDGKAVEYLKATINYTSLFNLTGSPVVVIPIGYTKDGLPIGVQLVGRRWKDMQLLQAAQLINDAVGAFKNPPGY